MKSFLRKLTAVALSVLMVSSVFLMSVSTVAGAEILKSGNFEYQVFDNGNA